MSARTRKRLWRWRRSVLRRHDDRVEAWVLLVAWVLIVAGGALAWAVTARAVEQDFAGQRADRHAVRAVLLTDARPTVSTASETYRASAEVRWTAPDGTARTAQTPVPAGLPAGSAFTVWQDGRGTLTRAPVTPGEARTQAALFGAAAAGAVTGLVHGTAALARWRLDERRYARWGTEWETVGPQWDHETG
ncbi:hypothetical protein ABZ719_26400 [Streptomyces sp. NPDC006743]|uniref:Rv1733c family protein n=1 Tax=Streptomyces sp. NPDC006743 TaxID=3154480 RepID=UPI003456DB70